MVVDLEFLRSLWDRYLDLNPIYYLFDLCTCSIMDQNQKEMISYSENAFLNSIIDKEHNQQVFGIIAGD